MSDTDSDRGERQVRPSSDREPGRREREVVRKERPVKEGKEEAWLFLRTLSGVLLVAWLVPALFVPPNPFTFFLWLVATWSVGIIVAVWLVYRDGYRTLEASNLYNPRFEAGRALSVFVAGTIVMKIASTLALDVLVGGRPYLVDAGFSALALVVAYLFVYQGARGRANAAGGEPE